MTVRSYTDVSIQNNPLSSVENAQKSLEEESALNTLDKIEEVIRKNLSDSNRSQDEYDHSEKSETVFPIFNLPRDLIPHVFKFLPSFDLMKMAQASKSSYEEAKKIQIIQAQDCGYERNDYLEAKNYLNQMSQAIDTLVKNGDLPKEYVIRNNPFGNIDVNETLQKIKNLDSDKKDALKTSLAEKFFKYIKNQQLEIVRVLLKFGANPNMQDNKGETPLFFAMHSKFTMYNLKKEIVSLLLKYDADPNIATVSEFTPICANTNHSEITKLLCKKNADVNKKTSYSGYSPLHFTVIHNQFKTAKVLLKHGADPNLKNNKEKTPLFLALDKDSINKKLVSLLLRYGADPLIANQKGITPLDLSLNTERQDVIELLRAKVSH